MDATNIGADELSAWLAEPDPTLVVVGAGLSIPGPASAPSVGFMRDRTLDLLAERSSSHALSDAVRQRLFPEVVYGALAEVTGCRDVLTVWDVLSRTTTVGLGARPNAGHLAVVGLAARVGWGLVTTNFDTFLEQAADQAGLRASTTVLKLEDSATDVDLTGDDVAIVKVHGTADDARAVRSTVGDLSQAARSINGLRLTPNPTRLLVIGYSGRDFDLFPRLVRDFSSTSTVWVDPYFTADHRGVRLGARLYRSSWDRFAQERLGALPHDAPHDLPDRYERAIAERVRDVVGSELDDRGTAVAAVVNILATSGAHQAAAALAAQWRRVRAPSARLQTLLWAAHSLSSVDRFDEALLMARRARSLAWRRRRWWGLGRASIAATYARISRLWLQITPSASSDVRFTVPRIAVLCLSVWTAAVWAIPAAIVMGRLRGDAGDRLSRADEFRFAADYVEHLIRLLTYPERVAAKFAVARPVMTRVWAAVADLSASVGYTWGVVNVSKYTSRVTGHFDQPGGSVVSADMMGDLVTMCIARRDAARYSAGSIDDRKPLALEALELARELDCPSLILKTLVVLAELDPAGPPDPGEVRALLDREAQAQGVVAQRRAVEELLLNGL